MADVVLISMNINIMLSLYYVCSLCPPNYLFKSDDAKYISFFITQSAPRAVVVLDKILYNL